MCTYPVTVTVMNTVREAGIDRRNQGQGRMGMMYRGVDAVDAGDAGDDTEWMIGMTQP